MGGNSSKSQRRGRPNRHGDGEDSSTFENSTASKSVLVNSNNPKAKKKKNKKNNVKIDESAKKRKSDKGSKRSRLGSSQRAESIIFVESTGEPSSPVYRKKSSCPSCDAKDLQKASNRGRSGSEKSLRYSDFNKVQRKTKVYDWELAPVDIPLYGVAEPIAEDTCYVCGVYTGRLVRTCCVCFRSFHDGCLAKIGHGLTDAARTLLKLNIWSCHQCVSLNHMLTQEEVKSATDMFDQLGLCKEKIPESSYLQYCQASVHQDGKTLTPDMRESCLSRYRQVDRTGSGELTWTQFLNLESVRILQQRCKDSLVRLLTQAELAKARRIFQKLDLEQTGFTTKEGLHAMLDSDKSRRGAYYPDEEPMYSESELLSLVSWGEFLRGRAIYILAQRPNLRQPGNHDDDVIEDGAMTPSFESIEGTDEQILQTKPSIAASRKTSREQSLNRLTSQQDSSMDQLSSLDISTSILDDLTSELNKRCSQNADGDENTNAKSSIDSAKPVGQGQSSPGPSQQAADFQPEVNKTGPERCHLGLQSSQYLSKDGEQSRPQRRSGVTTVSSSLAQRKSEIINRDEPQKDAPKTARQAKCKSMQVAPAYGGLVGKMRHQEWNC